MWPFTKKKEEPKGTEYVMESPKEEVKLDSRVIPLRLGMWVDYAGHVGILHKMKDDMTAEVHLVASDGTTCDIVETNVLTLKQARKSQVPECRKGCIDKLDYQE